MTTNKLSNQEVFNVVWERAKDKRQAKKEEGWPVCWYRMGEDPNGLACFAGALIPNEEYSPQFELNGAVYANPWFSDHVEDIEFLGELQTIHDGYIPEEWEGLLRDKARQYGLEVPKS